MEFVKLALNNLLRHKVRSILTLVGIASSVAVLFSIISFNRGFEKGLADELDKTGIHFMIMAVGCPHEVASLVLHGAIMPKYIDMKILETVRNTKGVELASPMLIAQLANHKRNRVDLVHGLLMSHAMQLKAAWKFIGALPTDDNGIILGSEVAAHDKVKIGDIMEYDGRSFTVSAILEQTGSQDDAFTYMPIRALQEILQKTDGLTAIGVKIESPEQLDLIIEELSANVPGIQVVTMSEVMRSLASLAESAKILSLSIAAIAVLISAIGVMNSIMMAIFERTQEIGMMRAIGASRFDIFRIIIKETTMLTIGGGVSGILLAVLGAGLIEGFVRSFMPYVPSGRMIHFDPWLAGVCIVFSLLIGLVAGAYPAWKASRITPIEAIKG